MYKIIGVKEEVRVPPEKFSQDLEESIKDSLGMKIEGKLISELGGVVVAVVGVRDVGEGRMIPEDGAFFFPAEVELLVYAPEMQEIVEGAVVDVTEFGAFVRMGPIDGLVHVSQVMDDFVSYDKKSAIFSGRESKKTVKEGDDVRARVVSISLSKGNKIGLTMRQPLLGGISVKKDK